MAEWGSGGPSWAPIPGPVAQMVAFTRLRIAIWQPIPTAGVVNRILEADFFNGLASYPKLLSVLYVRSQKVACTGRGPSGVGDRFAQAPSSWPEPGLLGIVPCDTGHSAWSRALLAWVYQRAACSVRAIVHAFQHLG